MAGNTNVNPYCELYKLIVDSTIDFYHFSVSQAPVTFLLSELLEHDDKAKYEIKQLNND